MKVAVALSGGVDSATAAALLQGEGHDLVGIMLRVGEPSADEDRAAALCRKLGIPFTVVDVRDRFEALVIAPFVAAYAAGRTPNPCVLCNEHVKFGLLLDEARSRGAERLATGHYARIAMHEGRPSLFRGRDPAKEQSYFLARVPAERWAEVLFPLGDLHKTEVKREARRLGLDMVPRGESQEVCFVGPGGPGEEVRRRSEAGTVRPGDIVDTTGRVRARHRGVAHYTVGQRRGLGVADREPLYVVGLDAEDNRVIIGPERACLSRRVVGRGARWAADAPAAGRPATVQVRYRHDGVAGRLFPHGDEVIVELASSVRGVAPGQAMVFYEADRVLGSAWIEQAS